MKYYVGIDGGGTKTAFLCYSEKNEKISEFVLPSCHILQVEKEEAVRTLKSGMKRIHDELDIQEKDEIYICAGLAGYGRNQNIRKKIEEVCAESFGNHVFVIKNDAEIALEGALNGNDGILLIAGTGSIALAKKNKEYFRSGGWGYQIGDEGSAFWIAKKLLQAYSMQNDGRMPKTLLSSYLMKACHLYNEYDMIAYVSDVLEGKRDKIAQLAIYAYDLAEQNDPVAISIYEEAALCLWNLIQALQPIFDGKILVSYAGGVWKAKEYILEPLRKLCDNDIEIVKPFHSPAYGAYLIAKYTYQKF